MLSNIRLAKLVGSYFTGSTARSLRHLVEVIEFCDQKVLDNLLVDEEIRELRDKAALSLKPLLEDVMNWPNIKITYSAAYAHLWIHSIGEWKEIGLI